MLSPRDLIGWLSGSRSKDSAALKAAAHPQSILQDFGNRIPKYLDDTDQGKLIYPACKRTSSDAGGDVRAVWDHTRLEAMRYVMMVPGSGPEQLIEPLRQSGLLDAFLRQPPHEDLVIDFTSSTMINLAIAIGAGFNWLNNCAVIAGVDRTKTSGTLRNFRKITVQAQRWWAMEGAVERANQMLSEDEKPPLMLYLILTEYTRLAKEVATATLADTTIRLQRACDPADLSR